MEAGVSTARKHRAEHRHDLRTLTYLTVNHVNAGVIRNLNQSGVGAQVVRSLRPGERVRVQFELRAPKVKVETWGEVIWATSAGACGIRFVELPMPVRQPLNAWIFGDLLESVWLHAGFPGEETSGRLFGIGRFDDAGVKDPKIVGGAEGSDGLMLSGRATKVIQLPLRPSAEFVSLPRLAGTEREVDVDWLSQPLSARAIARLIDSLAVIAAFLLFAFVFLSVTGEIPRWPFTMAALGAVVVATVYWGFFWVFGGRSLGSRVARSAGLKDEDKDQ